MWFLLSFFFLYLNLNFKTYVWDGKCLLKIKLFADIHTYIFFCANYKYVSLISSFSNSWIFYMNHFINTLFKKYFLVIISYQEVVHLLIFFSILFYVLWVNTLLRKHEILRVNNDMKGKCSNFLLFTEVHMFNWGKLIKKIDDNKIYNKISLFILCFHFYSCYMTITYRTLLRLI